MGKKITIAGILSLFAFIVVAIIFLKAITRDYEGAIIDLANSQIPFWVGLPSGIIVIGFILLILFRKPIMDFINNFDLSGGL
jgi:hypothetical protein